MLLEASVAVGSSIICDILSNIISEVVTNRFNYEVDKSKIELVVKRYHSSFNVLEEHHLAKEFVQSPNFIDSIYLLAGANFYRNMVNKIQSPELKDNDTLEKEVFDHLATDLYQKMRTETIIHELPEKKELIIAFEGIGRVINEIIATQLDTNTKMTISVISNGVNTIEQVLNNILKNIKEILHRSLKFDVAYQEQEFISIKNVYSNILKSKYANVHIHMLEKLDFATFYVPPFLNKINHEVVIKKGRITSKRKGINNLINTWKYIFDNHSIVYIIGGAGYGKSLFMKKIINDYVKMNILDSEAYIVIYGELKSFHSNNSEIPISMMDFLKQSIRKSTLLDDSQITNDFINYYLKAGRCIILLDALDEVDKLKREELYQNIIAFFSNQNPNNKICITTRNRSYIPDKNIEVFEIMPLDDKQVELYIENLIKLGKFDVKDKEIFMNQSENLIRKGFLSSFLALSLLINIYKAERELPENKLELYQKCFEYMATKREKDKIGTTFNWKNIGPLMIENTFITLSDLCYPNNKEVKKEEIKNKLVRMNIPKFGTEVDAENAIEDFLTFCSERTELFVLGSEDCFRFFHRSFFEYFYSQNIFVNCCSIEEIYNKFTEFDIDSEVFELTTAMLKQKTQIKYQGLIEYILHDVELDFSKDAPTLLAFNILILCMQVVDDVLYKQLFINIITKNREILLNNLEHMNNDKCLLELIVNKPEYYSSLNETFYFESLFDVLQILKDCFEDCSEKVDAFYYAFRYIVKSRKISVFTRIFINTSNLEAILDNMSRNDLTELKKYLNVDNKVWYGIPKTLRQYQKLEPVKKKTILEDIKRAMQYFFY